MLNIYVSLAHFRLFVNGLFTVFTYLVARSPYYVYFI